MEGFLRIRLKPWLRRLFTRCIAIIPAAIVAGVVPFCIYKHWRSPHTCLCFETCIVAELLLDA